MTVFLSRRPPPPPPSNNADGFPQQPVEVGSTALRRAYTHARATFRESALHYRAYTHAHATFWVSALQLFPTHLYGPKAEFLYIHRHLRVHPGTR